VTPSGRLRAEVYLALHALRGSRQPRHYRAYLRQDRERSYPDPSLLLAETLDHAVRTVPRYRGIARPGESRADPFSVLARFPVLERDDVRRVGPSLLSAEGDRRRWRRNTSGGSTGEPVLLFQDPGHLARTVAIRDVYSRWAGGGLGEPELYIWGSERDLLAGRESLTGRLGNRLLRRTLLNAFDLSDDSILAILEGVRTGAPKLVVSYAQAGYEVARFARERGISLPPQLGLISTAGTLYPFMRKELEETFGCRVLDRYGSRETGDMAGECEQRRGLHVLPWSCHIEVLGDDGRPAGPGETGDVVVTGHTNRAMPLIRYRIGDRARVPAGSSPCPCGRHTPMLAAIAGRVVDTFVAASGTRVDGEYFAHLLYFRPWLRQFEVIQRAPDEVVYRVVAPSGVPATDAEEITAKTRSALGQGCGVVFETLDAIPPSGSGKRSYTRRAF
jgi:phenylacetate-CoA ligase